MFEFDHIIKKEKIEEEDKIEDIVNEQSKFESSILIEPAFLNVHKGDAIQLERRGYFYVDDISVENKTGRLHYIPDGKSNPMSIIKKKVDPKMLSQGVEIKKKKQEKTEKNKEKKDKKDKENNKEGSRKGSETNKDQEVKKD